jgi:putative transposase
MFRLFAIIGAALHAALLPRGHLVLENLALRQQVAVLARKRPRPALTVADRAFWVVLRRVWSGWAERLVIVKPDTVVRWHRAGFRLYWTWRSRRGRTGRPRVDREIRDLIRRMVSENGWGAPRIHGELQKLGIDVSERTVSRYLPRRRADPEKVQRWMTFLRNHAGAIAAMDLFVVPTATFRVLYGFFVIGHGRRRVLHFNATLRPTAAWVIQQLREAFPENAAPRYLLFDRDTIFSAAVVAFVRATGTEPVRSAYRSPWQNPVAERWIGSCRRELLDHVVVLGERHLVDLVRSYLGYYHDDRTHLGLDKDTPAGRSVVSKPSSTANVVALPRVGGLHHRYEWRNAA